MHSAKIVVVVPTVRPHLFQGEFLKAWEHLFVKHEVLVVAVNDGDNPTLSFCQYCGQNPLWDPINMTPEQVMGTQHDLIYYKNDGCRNLGFAFVAVYVKDAEIIITLDDDVTPVGDTIQDHIDALSRSYPTTWMNTSMTTYMRGFPYWVRDERPAVISHGVWTGVPDLDASHQLVLGPHDQDFYRGPIPHGIYFPMCIMNVAFKREFLKYMYQAPMFGTINRFADIWGGYYATRAAHDLGVAVVTGYATIDHQRASNPFANLIKEAQGVDMHEYLTTPFVQKLQESYAAYFELYAKRREEWAGFIDSHTPEQDNG